MKTKSSKKYLPIALGLLISSLILIFGLSIFTGNNSNSGIGTSKASAQEPADINNDNVVNIFDLSTLLSNWGTNNDTSDINNDNTVNVFDLSMLLSKWGVVIVVEPPANGFPDSSNTGPRFSDSELTPSASVVSTYDGQIIEKLIINGGGVRISHSNVVVRDVKIIHTSELDGSYPISIKACTDCGVPTNVTIEYVEIDGNLAGPAGEGTPAVYGVGGGWTLRYADIHGMGSGPRITNNNTVEYSYIHDMANNDPAEHKSGIGLNGGANHVIRGNNINCDAAGCSSALSLYGSYAQVDNVLVENNLFNTTGSYCTYGGSVSSKDYPVGNNIRYLNNTFGREHNPNCGQFGYMASWSYAGGANVWSGNRWGDGAAADSNHQIGDLIP